MGDENSQDQTGEYYRTSTLNPAQFNVNSLPQIEQAPDWKDVEEREEKMNDY